MTTSVPCDWAGAVMQKLLAKGKFYGPMDGWADMVTYRATCM